MINRTLNRTIPSIAKFNNIRLANSKCALPDIKKLRYIPDNFLKQDKTGTYEDFIEKFKQNYPDTSLKSFILKMRFCKKPIGQGAEARVYNIPNVDGYYLKISKKSNLNLLLKKTKPLKKNR